MGPAPHAHPAPPRSDMRVAYKIFQPAPAPALAVQVIPLRAFCLVRVLLPPQRVHFLWGVHNELWWPECFAGSLRHSVGCGTAGWGGGSSPCRQSSALERYYQTLKPWSKRIVLTIRKTGMKESTSCYLLLERLYRNLWHWASVWPHCTWTIEGCSYSEIWELGTPKGLSKLSWILRWSYFSGPFLCTV